ncbi:MAG: indole-3-glycerol phosphate synthase TrpC, partial [Alicyclobacillus sp.]|nr:indole-3-glycerol phosphate synthase TrpC [Alicyclobacillus sp.]
AIRTASRLAVIAEVKQASPSQGRIAERFNPVEIAHTYEQAGACAISVLTDGPYFQGSLADLQAVRAAVNLPVLRKDFILDEAQIEQARVAGADAVLLIAAALPPQRLQTLSLYAQSLGLDVLVEVHRMEELPDALAARPSVLGVNNRDLHTFQVSLETTRRVLAAVPAGQLTIAESGVTTADDALFLAQCGARGILVGEALMRQGDPAAVAALLQSLRVPLPAEVKRP